MLESEPYSELRVPSHGSAIGTSIGYSLILFFSLVATCNLFYAIHIPRIAFAASLLWLLLVVWLVGSSLREEGGVKQYFVNRFGAYSNHHFVRATPDVGRAVKIYFGYELFGRAHRYLAVDTDAISSIDWGSGQATALSGRNMDDWHVALWYHHPHAPQREPFPRVRDEEVFIIGPSVRKEAAETLGRQLVDFLKSVGVELAPGKHEREFNTPSRRTAIEQSDEREQ
jgi:hypothetical protein